MFFCLYEFPSVLCMWESARLCRAISRESTAQVKGSGKMMVTVVATQELEAGDVLWRFKAEAGPDQPRRGNNNDQYKHIQTYL